MCRNVVFHRRSGLPGSLIVQIVRIYMKKTPEFLRLALVESERFSSDVTKTSCLDELREGA